MGAASGTTTINTGTTMWTWISANDTWMINQSNFALSGGTIFSDDGHNILNGPLTLNADSTLQVQWNNKDLTVMGAVTGSAGLIKTGSGTAILASSGNNWLGNTTLTLGTLQIGNANAAVMPDLAGQTITFGGGTLAFNTNTNITLQNATITGTGAIVQLGSGTLTLNGSYPGFTGTINAGNLYFGGSAAYGFSATVNGPQALCIAAVEQWGVAGHQFRCGCQH